MDDNRPVPLAVDYTRESITSALGSAAILVSALSGSLASYELESDRWLEMLFGSVNVSGVPQADLNALAHIIGHSTFALALIARNALDAAEQLGADRQEIIRATETLAENWGPEIVWPYQGTDDL